ncbi:histidine phosphatase family protein [Clostridia bacterium]|nr:histidine phosphatase family protein [Clostridia bacterium]
MDIILFRHGIAEERGKKTDDSKRALTEEGIQKIQRAALVLNQVLDVEKLSIWHSPLLRTVQTAEILREVWGLKEMTPKDWIASGEDWTFEKSLGDAQKETLVIVGHAPMLDFWCEDLCGEKIKLKKGGAVCIRWTVGSEGELAWLMQPKGWQLFAHRR